MEYDDLYRLITEGNWRATAVGLGGMLLITLFGFLLKYPMQRQAVRTEREKAENDRFKAQVAAFEAMARNQDVVIQAQAKEIAYLQSQNRISMEYEAEILRQLRECREQQITGGRRASDPPG